MQTAIVTGASKGLGRAIAIELGRAGYAVVVAARDQAGLDETVALAKAAGAPATLAVAAASAGAVAAARGAGLRGDPVPPAGRPARLKR